MWAEPLGFSKVGHTARSMESQIWHQLAGSVGGRFRKGTIASTHLDSRHFIFARYATGAFQIATPMLELKGSVSE